jgi:cbb3-type cytochrome oxidase subunit 3
MTTLLAAYADKVIIEALWRFLPIAMIAVAFGFVYWLYRRRKSKREDAERKKWIEERRAQRGAGKKDDEPADR